MHGLYYALVKLRFPLCILLSTIAYPDPFIGSRPQIMASSTSPKAEPPEPPINDIIMTDQAGLASSTSSIEEIKTALYNHCVSKPPNTVFSQADLMATSMIPAKDPTILHAVTQALTRSGHLRLMQRAGSACWRCVPLNLATVQAALDPDASLVYSHIESAGREGVWSNQLNRRTNFHKVVMDKCIKVLEQRRLIKAVPNFRHPNRKTYMLWGLQPAEDVTGGPFYNDGDLDEEFVRQMSLYIERWIIGRSWYFPPHSSSTQERGKKPRQDGKLPKSEAQPTKTTVTKEEAEDARDNAMEKSAPAAVGQGRSRSKHMRPFPTNYGGYPSVTEITNALNDVKISTTTMKIADTQILVDILIWDGRIERLKQRGGKGRVREVYRAVRHPIVEQDDVDTTVEGVAAGTGLTEAPCGRCPVFDICEEGGLVSARTCPYFQEWLDY